MSLKAEVERWGVRIVGVGSVDCCMNASKGHKPKEFLLKARSVVTFSMSQFKVMVRWRNFMNGSEMNP